MTSLERPSGEDLDFSADDRSDPELAAILAEAAERLRLGQSPSLDEYLRLHPEHAGRIAVLWPTIGLMGRLRLPRIRERGEPPDPRTVIYPRGGPGLIGDFRILREIGRGGMGIVYEAEQLSLRRRVALKVLPASALLDPRQIERFQAEARAAACLHHPHIVPVHAVGCEDGIHYFAMQLIEGPTLAEFIRGRNRRDDLGRGTASREDGIASFKEAAELIRQAADAIEEAHRNGIVHRDIKPSNLLLDPHGKLWVTDFGLARIRGDGNLTRTGEAPGTLRYMSPEQVSGDRGVVDFRCDVYSLGVTLYELVALRPAFPGDDVEVLRKIVEVEPIAPRQIDRAIPVDLETIILKALSKEPSGRYASAREMHDDLRRFLEGRPVRARRPTILDRAIKLGRRNRRGVMVTAAVGLVGVASIFGGLIWSNAWLKSHSRQLQAEIERADRHAEAADRQRRLSDLYLHDARIRLAQQALDEGRHERAQDILDEIRPGPDGSDPRPFAWHYLSRQSRRTLIRLRGNNPAIGQISLSEDGKTLVSSGSRGSEVWDLASERLLRQLVFTTRPVESSGQTPGREPEPRDILSLDFIDPTSGRLIERFDPEPGDRGGNLVVLPGCFLSFATLSPSKVYTHRTWDLSGAGLDPTSCFRIDHPETIQYHWNSRFFIVDEGVKRTIRDARDGAVRLSTDRIKQLILGGTSADGRYLVLGSANEAYRLYDPGEQPRQIPLKIGGMWRSGESLPFVISDGGDRVAGRWESGQIRIWDRPTDRVITLAPAESDPSWIAEDFTFSRDGNKLCSTAKASDRREQVTLWDTTTGDRLAVFPGRDVHYSNPLFAPDGRSLYIAGGRNLLRWSFEKKSDGQPIGHGDEAWAVAYRPDGEGLASGSDDKDLDGSIRVWDPRTGQIRLRWHAGPGTVSTLAYSPDGRILASGHFGPRDTVRLWDPETGKLRLGLTGHESAVRSVAFSRDGQHLASAGDDRAIRLWDTRTGEARAVHLGHTDKIRSIAFTSDGRTLVSAANDATIRIWDPETGRAIRVITHTQKFSSLAILPGDSSVAAADEDGIISIWDMIDGNRLKAFQGDYGELRSVAVTPDGRTLAVAEASGKIQVWDLLTGQQILTLDGHKAQVNSLVFDPEGRTLASCGHDGAVRFWRSR